MSQFEYITILASIISALAISEILSQWGRLIRLRGSIRSYPLYLGWTFLMLLFTIQLWWGFWTYRTVDLTTFPALLAFLSPLLTIVLAVYAITPDASQMTDLRAFYFTQRRWFFPLVALALIELIALDVVVADHPLIHVENAIRALGVVALAAVSVSSSERLHQVVLALAGALLLVFVGVGYAFTR